MDTLSNAEIFERVFVSILAGSIIGLEREWKNKPAGVRTYALVCEGAALFMIAGLLISAEARPAGFSDPARIASTVVQGVGFIAGGVIFTYRAQVKGLTTAAGLWVTAAVGIAIGAGFFFAAAIGVAASLFTLVPLRWLERGLLKPDRKLAATAANGEENVSDEANLE